MRWLLLASGIIPEVCGTTCMKLFEGLSSGGLASSPILAADDGWQCDSASVGAGVVFIGPADCDRGAWGSVSFMHYGGTVVLI